MRFSFASVFASVFVSSLLVACTAGQSGDPSFTANANLDRAPAAADGCATLRAKLAPAVDAVLPETHAVDLGVAVSTPACPSLTYVAGPSHIDDAALWRIGSITKTFTAAVILNQIDQGKLSLDDTIASYGLGIPNDDQITIRMLLEHTSGIATYTQGAFLENPKMTPAERIAYAATLPPLNAVGAAHHYSNTNYVILGVIAERIGGAPIQTLIRKNLLEPIGLEHTYFAGAESLPPTEHVAPSFGPAADATRDIIDQMAWADGAVVASLADTTKWMSYFASGDLLPHFKAETFQGFPSPELGPGGSYGFALMNLPAGAGSPIVLHGHNGAIPGFVSWSLDIPSLGTLTIVGNAYESTSVDPALDAVISAMVAALPPQ